MMISDKDILDTDTVEKRLKCWRQGDVTLGDGLDFVHIADPSCPCDPSTQEVFTHMDVHDLMTTPTLVTKFEVGAVVLTQTCDLQRTCKENPFVEVAPVIVANDKRMREVCHGMNNTFAFIPNLEEMHMVADLRRSMTVEKAVLARWKRLSGCRTDAEAQDFSNAVAHKFNRFAFPQEFVDAVEKLRTRITKKCRRKSAEGAHAYALKEVRVQAEPSWSNDETRIQLTWWFIIDQQPDGYAPDWETYTDKWIGLFDTSGRFEIINHGVRDTDNITLREYENGIRLDFDRLSTNRAQLRK